MIFLTCYLSAGISPACPTGSQQPLIAMTTIKPEDSLATRYSLPYLPIVTCQVYWLP